MKRLRRAATLCIGILCIAIGAIYLVRSATSSQMSQQPVIFDFGAGRQGDKIGHVFQLQNKGSAPLTIAAVTPNCGCTVVNSAPKQVAAHSTIDLPIEVHLTRPGPIQTAVVVSYVNHDPTTFLIRGKVVYQFPKEVVFKPVLRGGQEAEDLVIHAVSRSPLHIVSLKYDKALFDIRPITSEDLDPRNVSLRIGLRPDLNYGTFSSFVDVETDDDVEPVKRVRVAGRVRSTVEVEPSRSVDRIALGEVKTRHFAVFSPYGRKILIRDITVSPLEALKCDHGQIKEQSDRIDVPITMTAAKSVGAIVTGSITVKVAIEGRDEILPPLSWYVMTVEGGSAR